MNGAFAPQGGNRRPDPSVVQHPPHDPSITEHMSAYRARLAGGQLGALPALTGLVLFSVIFTVLRPHFLSAGNLANLFTQGAAVTVIAMGLVFVLLLGEIDLSAAVTGGVCGAVMALLLEDGRMPWYAGVGAALLTGTAIGLGLGLLVARTRIPSYVVTLAALLGLQGVTLVMIGGSNSVAVKDEWVLAITDRSISPAVSWFLYAGGALIYVMLEVRRKRRGAHHRRSAEATGLIVWRVVLAIAISGVVVFILCRERSPNPDLASLKGVPVVVPIIAVLIMFWSFVLRRTAYGRRLYAVGQGPEAAAHEPGVHIEWIRISAFVICSSMAAIGGIIAVSRAHAADSETGGVNILLYAIAAAVIGGTSLFGGKGRVLDAVLGGALMAVIDNGMSLLNYGAGVTYIGACAFLLLAAGIDVLSRQRQATVAVIESPQSGPHLPLPPSGPLGPPVWRPAPARDPRPW